MPPSPEPREPHADVHKASYADEKALVSARQVVRRIDEGLIPWSTLVSLHRSTPVPRNVDESFMRTQREQVLADGLKAVLLARFGREENFDDVAHTAVTYIIDRSPPPSLLDESTEATREG